MLLTLKSLFAPKERLIIHLSGFLSTNSFQFDTQRLISQLGLMGYMRANHQGAYLEVEGPRPKLDALVEQLKVIAARCRLSQTQLSFQPYKGDLAEFRIQNN